MVHTLRTKARRARRIVTLRWLVLAALATGPLTSQAAPTADRPRPAQAPPIAAPPLADLPVPKVDALDFDLLAPPVLPQLDAASQALEESLATRRRMLTWHQTLGLGLVASMAGTMITGQLNYGDRFGAAQSGRYEFPHQIFAYTTLAAFTGTGLLALFAPVPPDRQLSFDRVLLHRICLGGATLGMVTQAVLGLLTARSNGLVQQQTLAGAHLAVGYATLGFMAVGVGAIVF